MNKQKLEDLFFDIGCFFECDNMTKLGQMVARLWSSYRKEGEGQHYDGMSINRETVVFCPEI